MPERAWRGLLAADRSDAAGRGEFRFTLAEVEALGVVAQRAWDAVKRVGLEQPNWGSGEPGSDTQKGAVPWQTRTLIVPMTGSNTSSTEPLTMRTTKFTDDNPGANATSQ